MTSLNKCKPTSFSLNKVNTKVRNIPDQQKLVRLTLANLLWENQVYSSGDQNVETIQSLVAKVDPTFVSELALVARSHFKLRHIPLLLLRELARNGTLKADDLAAVIQRPDEMGEFLSIYWKEGKTPISSQVKKGLAKAFLTFSEYSLAKWDKNSASVSIRDVMFLTHPKPATPEQEAIFKRIAAKEMQTPGTWETQLSAGADKCKTFTRLMEDKKLGALAYLRNLHNMVDSGVSSERVHQYITELDTSKVLPFRFVAAAKTAPQFSNILEKKMLTTLSKHTKLPGKTVLLVDVSGSMFGTPVSAKSDLDRFDAAATLAILCKEICENVKIFSFSCGLVKVNSPQGFPLITALVESQSHLGTYLGKTLKGLPQDADRYIVFTDEQSHDVITAPPAGSVGYIVNVASYANGVNHSKWTTITGFSESVIAYIQALEMATLAEKN